MRLDEIMSRDVVTIAPTETAERAWARMRQKGVRHLVVTRSDEVVGVLTDRDLGGPRAAKLRQGKKVSDLMTPKPITVRPRTTVRQAANRMRGRSIGSLIVAEEGKLVGIVTISDLLDVIGRGLETPETKRKDSRRSRPAKTWAYPRGGKAPRR